MSQRLSRENASHLSQRAQLTCGFITRLAWSPDGRVLALAHGGGLWLWEREFGGSPTRRIEGHSSPVKDVAFSPDSSVIASASSDMTVRLWLVASGQPLHVIRRHSDAVNAVAFSADGQRLASGGADQHIVILDMLDSNGSLIFAGHKAEITSIAFSGDTLASGGWDSTIRLWDVAERRERVTIRCADWIREITVSPDAKLFAAACKDGTLQLIEGSSGAVVRVIQAHEHGADCAAFSPDGALLVSGGRDHQVKVWDVENPSDQPLVTLEGHDKPVLTVAFHPAGELIVSGSGDNTVRLWGLVD